MYKSDIKSVGKKMSSPYPIRKKRARGRGTTDNNQDLDVSEQVDAFIADVIENAKKEYLAETEINNGQICLDESSTCSKLNDKMFTSYNSTGENADGEKTKKRLRLIEDNNPAKHIDTRRETNEDRPLLEKDINNRKGTCRRLFMRFIGIVTCWHCTCIRDVYEIT